MAAASRTPSPSTRTPSACCNSSSRREEWRSPANRRRRHDRQGLPADCLALVLFIEPPCKRGEVLEHCAGIQLPLVGEGGECIRPRLALAHCQHPLEPRTGLL